MRRELESNPSSAHAFAVRGKEDRKKDEQIKPADPKRPRPEANEKWSIKWAPCRWCKGAHWHKDCPKRRSKGDKPTPKPNRRDTESRATLATVESAESNAEQPPITDSTLSALFAQDGGEIPFTLDASGRALCLQSSNAEPSAAFGSVDDNSLDSPRACIARASPVTLPNVGVMNR
eukprot:3061024-Pleurochrysis_carterae.AAC.1